MFSNEEMQRKMKQSPLSLTHGEVQQISEHMLISKGPVCKIGDICVVGKGKVPCEVVSLKGPYTYLMPFYDLEGLSIKDHVYRSGYQFELPPVETLQGRILNGLGQPIDHKGKLIHEEMKQIPLVRTPPNPLDRMPIEEILETRIKAIDSMLTIGEGQKIGIFAGTGVGKSTLLGMIAKRAKADVNVICLVGERGREVPEFIRYELGEEGMNRSVLVISTSDEQPLLNIKSAQLATSIAEEFRDQGKKVLLMMDSVTRFAIARREIDHAIGLPTNQGKTPSMEPYMQKLLERAGKNQHGSITGIYTVLVEGDDFNAPIPDMARGILDGHIILDRKIAEKNQYPAIDVLNSISRVMDRIADPEHLKIAKEIRKYMAIYQENEDNFKLGLYIPGQDREVDKAKQMHGAVLQLLTQERNEFIHFEETLQKMKEVLGIE